MTPLKFEAPIRACLLRFSDDMAVRLGNDAETWISNNCETRPVLRFHNQQFKISFDDNSDLTMFQLAHI